MALTYSQQSKTSVGGRWQTVTTITLDASYPTGGYTLDASPTGLGLPDGLADVVIVGGSPVNTGGAGTAAIDAAVNTANGKLQIFTAAGAEQAGATNLSTNTLTLVAIGR